MKKILSLCSLIVAFLLQNITLYADLESLKNAINQKDARKIIAELKTVGPNETLEQTEKNILLSLRGNVDNSTLLHNGVASQNIDNIKFIVTNFKDVITKKHYFDKDGDSILHDLTRYNTNPDIIKYIVEEFLYEVLSLKQQKGYSPIDYAFMYNNKQVIKLLVSIPKLTTIKLPDLSTGITSIHHAARYNKNPDVIEYLSQNYPNIFFNNKIKVDDTPFNFAIAFNKKKDVVERLVNKYKDKVPQIIKNSINSPLHLAAEHSSNTDTLEYLAEEFPNEFLNLKQNTSSNPKTPLELLELETKDQGIINLATKLRTKFKPEEPVKKLSSILQKLQKKLANLSKKLKKLVATN